ncbi:MULTISPECIES: DUF2617 family protein [Actinomadura]|jgi:hypothetical protein|uniref:DUF2617 family protein n=1 Tax=Actinomadura montaniterrae TaxID=1803903 RepID=A0A6L3VKB2_9ACTN|nr:DUF2617 family protein [Actinomadura montaniterrae]KAB2365601.1 DUF2617 family protein [Actinomadura montaniterrae]
MRTVLDTPYRDARADGLSFALGLPPLDALAVLPVERGGLTVQLRLLGASHQVIAGPLSETVACLPEDGGEPLPGSAATTLPGWSYDFTATTAVHADDAAFARAVDAVCARLADRGDALTGAFPGSRHAVTALALEHAGPDGAAAGGTGAEHPEPRAGIGWRTWHAYPQTREIVMTRSRLVRPT